MRRFAWIWFAGCLTWVVDGLVSAQFHSWQHAQLAFLVALVFLFAGTFYRSQPR